MKDCKIYKKWSRVRFFFHLCLQEVIKNLHNPSDQTQIRTGKQKDKIIVRSKKRKIQFTQRILLLGRSFLIIQIPNYQKGLFVIASVSLEGVREIDWGRTDGIAHTGGPNELRENLKLFLLHLEESPSVLSKQTRLRIHP